MKKLLTCILVIAMIASLVACSKKEDTPSGGSTEPPKSEEVTKPAETATPEPTATAEPTAEPTETPTAEPTEAPAEDTDQRNENPDLTVDIEKIAGCWVEETVVSGWDFEIHSDGSWIAYMEEYEAYGDIVIKPYGIDGIPYVIDLVEESGDIFTTVYWDWSTDEIERVNAMDHGDGGEWYVRHDYNNDDEFDGPGHDYDGIYVSDMCTLLVDPEGAAEVFLIYYGRNDNRNEWDEWYEFWTNYSTEDKTFTANGGYHKYADPDKDTEYDEDTVTFVVSGEKIICPELGNMEFISANEGDFIGGTESGYTVDALGNETWVMEVDKSEMKAKILGYSEFIGDNYLVTLDFYEQYKLPYSELVGKNIGDEVEMSNGNKVVIYGFFTQGENSDFNVTNDTYTDGCRVVVVWKNPEDIFTQTQLDNMGYYSDPDNANFGFVLNNEDGMFYGYNDWAWDDCYVDESYVAIPMVKLVVGPNTVVESAYSFDEDGNLRTFAGPEYLKLREDPERQEALEVKIYDDVSVYVTEITDVSGRSTGEIRLISEIYMP